MGTKNEDNQDYFAYTVSQHPSSPLFEDARYSIICSKEKLSEQYTGFAEGHLFFPKIVSVGKLTKAHIELHQTAVDNSSGDLEIQAACAEDMDAWEFSFSFLREGSKRMKVEGAYSAYYIPDQDHFLLALPLWEVYAIPAEENSSNEDLLISTTWASEIQRIAVEVIYPNKLLEGNPKDIYDFSPDIVFTFGSMRFIRKFVPHWQEAQGLVLRDLMRMDQENSNNGVIRKYRTETYVENVLQELRKFVEMRDRALEDCFSIPFETQFWGLNEKAGNI